MSASSQSRVRCMLLGGAFLALPFLTPILWRRGVPDPGPPSSVAACRGQKANHGGKGTRVTPTLFEKVAFPRVKVPDSPSNDSGWRARAKAFVWAAIARWPPRAARVSASEVPLSPSSRSSPTLRVDFTRLRTPTFGHLFAHWLIKRGLRYLRSRFDLADIGRRVRNRRPERGLRISPVPPGASSTMRRKERHSDNARPLRGQPGHNTSSAAAHSMLP